MRVSDSAFVLSAIRFADKRFMLRLYTRAHGLITMAANVGSSPSSKVRPAHVLPLTGLHIQFLNRQNRDVQVLTEVNSFFDPDFSGNIAKLTIAQFMAEVLVKSLKEQGAHPSIFDLLQETLQSLKEGRGLNTLHLRFLYQLAGELGFEPHNNRSVQQPYFDCREGSFHHVSLAFPLGLDEKDSQLFSEFLSDPGSDRWNLAARRQLLEIWLAYYQLHIPGFHELKSLEVLRDVLSA